MSVVRISGVRIWDGGNYKCKSLHGVLQVRKPKDEWKGHIKCGTGRTLSGGNEGSAGDMKAKKNLNGSALLVVNRNGIEREEKESLGRPRNMREMEYQQQTTGQYRRRNLRAELRTSKRNCLGTHSVPSACEPHLAIRHSTTHLPVWQ